METLVPSERDVILGWARQADPLEACGIITMSGRAIRIPNLSEEPNRFVMDHEEVVAAYRIHGDFAAIWHSHPEGQEHPSSEDCRHHPEGLPLLIVTLEEVWEWTLEPGYPLRVGKL